MLRVSHTWAISITPSFGRHDCVCTSDTSTGFPMESNKDEAGKCLELARSHKKQGNLVLAGKFAKKSNDLYPTSAAEGFLRSIEDAAGSSKSSGGDAGTRTNGSARGSSTATNVHPSAAGSHNRRGVSEKQNDDAKEREYTAEQLKVVKRVRECKVTEYYEIMGVKKDCEENDIKKAYRKVCVSACSASGSDGSPWLGSAR